MTVKSDSRHSPPRLLFTKQLVHTCPHTHTQYIYSLAVVRPFHRTGMKPVGTYMSVLLRLQNVRCDFPAARVSDVPPCSKYMFTARRLFSRNSC